ncbi:MAG: leucyl/phenylalanyl-tRNA--protein transferase [Woeseiaceae bacterium]|nr:leucyl/phenylalanyl-tRNA--protein transferase [Woeseiaceae bacterium]
MSQGRIEWLSPADPPEAFPDVSEALTEPDGLLAAGGDLRPERLLAAYARGIFPWFEEGQPILWWSPDPRCVLWPDKLHVSRRLRQQLRNSSAELRCNTAFVDVMRACAAKRRSQQGTWITEDMMAAYERLHRDGWAHSIEIWDGDRLVGGVYGLCIGRVFFGESMFSAEPNTSKMAMLGLTRHMQSTGLQLLDCQVASPHLFTLGAEFMSRAEFSAFLAAACSPPEPHNAWPTEAMPVSALFIA